MKNLIILFFAVITLTGYSQTVPTLTNVSAPQPPSITGSTGNIFANSVKNKTATGYAAFSATVGTGFGAGYTSLFGTDPNKNAYIYNSRGLLLPRITTVNRDLIATPQTGLFIYNTTTNAFNWYNGSAWTAVGTGNGTVTGVTGTADRITIGGTAAAPTIDIAATYVAAKANGGTGVNIASAALSLGTASSVAGRLEFLNAVNANTVTIAPGTTGANYSLTLPLDDGSANQVLQTDGSGVLTWQSFGTADFSAIPAYADNAAAFAAIGAGKLYYTDNAGEYELKVSH